MGGVPFRCTTMQTSAATLSSASQISARASTEQQPRFWRATEGEGTLMTATVPGTVGLKEMLIESPPSTVATSETVDFT